MEIQKGNNRFYIVSGEGAENAEIVYKQSEKDVMSIAHPMSP